MTILFNDIVSIFLCKPCVSTSIEDYVAKNGKFSNSPTEMYTQKKDV